MKSQLPLLLIVSMVACADPEAGVGPPAQDATLAGVHTDDAGSAVDAGPIATPLRLGDPLPGLTVSELAAFKRGKKVFERRFTPEEGLGPLYNATSCSSCHSTPTTGGSAQLYRNFFVAALDFGSIQSPLPDLPSVVLPAFGTGAHSFATFSLEGRRRDLPAMFGGIPIVNAQRSSIPIFGTGLFEFVTNATIFSNADPDDIDADGIHGRFNVDGMAGAGAVGRFGVKAQANNIEFFTRGPLQNQMGITSQPVLGSLGIASLCSVPVAQGGSGADDDTTDNDGVPDPEISSFDLTDLIAFTRFLAPPQPKEFDASAQVGQLVFDGIGCTACHIPELPTTRFGGARAYTDLLLHEMGPALSDGMSFGVPQFSTLSATTSIHEFRTQPLWGVSNNAPYLHDGRAETLHDAIALHGGEAQASRDAYMGLGSTLKNNLISFLEHL